jgi:uncharacterized protein (TIGR02594 family)
VGTTTTPEGFVLLSPFDLAQRFIGIKELPGEKDNPFIMSMLSLDQGWPKNDEVPWCSAFANYVAWLLRMPRSKSLRARSWLSVGRPVGLRDAKAVADVVVLKRGAGDQPGAEVLNAPGHVGFYAGEEGDRVLILGGNQGNSVSVAAFLADNVLGVRRLS